MAAKLLHSLTDDNPDLQKQIGCMTGIFQMFDRQNMLTGGRRIVGHNPKRIPHGNAHFSGRTSERESSTSQLKSSSLEKCSHKYMQDKQRVSAESSRASFSSSSRSSSFSSLDCNRAANQLEPTTFDSMIFADTPSRDPEMSLQDPPQQFSRQSFDLRDFVKDSMYSLRLQSKISDDIETKQRTPTDVKESLRVLAELQECRELFRSSSVSRDAPRFSYDGRDNTKSTLKLKDLPRLSLDSMLKSRQNDVDGMSGNRARPASVVAKLMGLETLPSSIASCDSSQVSSSSKNLRKPMPRIPIEPAPWKQIDGMKGTHRPASKSTRGPIRVPSTVLSVYSEIEMRLNDLEFTQSGKDLRALKQILDAMQDKGLLETPDQKGDERNVLSSTRSVESRKHRTKQESAIVIMKPAKLADGVPKLRRGEQVDNKKGTSKDPAIKSSQRENVNTKNNRKSSGLISSPRMQQKKVEVEKRSRPPTPPDSSKLKRQPPNKTHVESHSPGGRRRLKQPISRQSDDQMSEASFESRNLSSNETTIRGSSSAHRPSEKKCTVVVTSEEESSELSSVPLEYSSPVSVLDSVEYKLDSPPMKFVGKTLKVDISIDNETNSNTIQPSSIEINRKKLQKVENLVQKLTRLNSSHDEANTDYIASLCENTDPNHRYISEILLASGLLLRDLGSSLTDFPFHPSGHPINPDLFLVLEQTKANMTLKLRTEKHHRKLIFDVVNEILARKLAFVGTNSDPWFKLSKIEQSGLNAQKLLRELCSEIDELQLRCKSNEEDERWKNILNEDVDRSERWIGFDFEISGAVLDIERLIFKDLVDEIVIGEDTGLIIKPDRKKM